MAKKKKSNNVKIRVNKKEKIDKDFFDDDKNRFDDINLEKEVETTEKDEISENKEIFEKLSEENVDKMDEEYFEKTSNVKKINLTRTKKNKDIYDETADYLKENNLDNTFVDLNFFKNRKIDINDEEKPKKNIFFKILVTILFIALISYSAYSTYFLFINPKVKVKVVKKIVEKNITDENIVFLGDSITHRFDLDKYFDGYHVVNSGVDGNITDDILNNLEERVYQYNPSKVFLLIGINDLNKKNPDIDKIFNNIKKIIEDISENRPNAKIYVESIYPINNEDEEKIDNNTVGSRNNSVIKKINNKLSDLCKQKKIIYINMFDKLIDDDSNLKLDYTKEGLHISDGGYELISNELKKYLR